MKKFNLRSYGVWIDEGKVLTSAESYKDYYFNKFPGGGVEWGEGIETTLQREFQEELNLTVEVRDLIFVNRHFVPSKFHDTDQVICFYFNVKPLSSIPKDYLQSEFIAEEADITFQWKTINDQLINHFNLPLDQKVAQIIIDLNNEGA